MEEVQYGCDESITNDDNSIISERCWNENYRGDSRKWLIRDGVTKPSKTKWISTMKATHPFPFHEELEQRVGKRRATIMKKLYDEAADEIINERDAPPPVEEYCTEYDGNYNSNIEIKKDEHEEEKKKELFEKFPLYTSCPASFWKFKIDKYQRTHTHFPGLTTSVDLKNPFKRNSGFTKPISEVLDDCTL